MWKCLVVWITFVLGLLRFWITPRLNLPTAIGSYEAFSHLWVGGLFGAAIAFYVAEDLVQRKTVGCSTYSAEKAFRAVATWCLLWGLIISFLELSMFLLQKFEIL